jgi:hypothetical protein
VRIAQTENYRDLVLMSQLKAIIFLLIWFIAIFIDKCSSYLRERLLNSNPSTFEYGYVLCGNNKHRYDLLRMHYQLRHTWHSNLPIAIMHCDELYDDFKEILRKLDSNIILVDICPNIEPKQTWNSTNIASLSQKAVHGRLRGFFCKVGALIKSPFINTMIMDSDTIWFNNPENLFYSKSYQHDGSLFFRDRVFHFQNGIGKMPYSDMEDIYAEKFYNGYHDMNQSDAKRLFESNGITLFWGYVADRSFPQVNEHQDSSCLLVNRNRHPKLIQQLESWLFSFEMGYGDKEIFWISSTMANESFNWEPFLANQYGDCFGLIMHINPEDYERPTQALPLYMNAEYMAEKEVKAVGDFVRPVMTKAILATEVITNQSKAMASHDTYSKPITETGCTCNVSYECQTIPSQVNQFILLSQWVLLSQRILQRLGPGHDCIMVKVEYLDYLNRIFQKISKKDCSIIGCPHLPVQASDAIIASGKPFCDPIYFSYMEPANFSMIANKARGIR